MLVGTSSSLPLPPLSFWYIQASASTQAKHRHTTEKVRACSSMCCYGSTACYVHYNCSKTICPKIKSERLKWIKCGLLTLDRTGFFSCFILKKHTHLFFGQNPVKTATVHTLLQHTQPLHSRVAPLLCLPPLARLF